MWELIFVEGLADRRIAVIEKLHHSMADGLAAAELATVLLDLSPEPAELDRDAGWEPRPERRSGGRRLKILSDWAKSGDVWRFGVVNQCSTRFGG